MTSINGINVVFTPHAIAREIVGRPVRQPRSKRLHKKVFRRYAVPVPALYMLDPQTVIAHESLRSMIDAAVMNCAVTGLGIFSPSPS